MPFFSQLSKNDWKERGFKDEYDAVFWQTKSCGMACIKMVLDMHPEHAGAKFAELIHEMEEKGVYRAGVGCVHQGITEELNVRGIDAGRMKINNADEFKKLIDQDNIFIVSVGAGFSKPKNSGHLVPVIGYTEQDEKIESIIIHHTSSNEDFQWPEKEIEVERFFKHFSGNAIRVRLYKDIL